MYRTVILFFTIVAIPYLISAQGKISGVITDAATKQALEGATISILNKQTSIFINYGTSNKKGLFQVGGLPLGIPMEVIVSFSGYKDTSTLLTLKASDKTFNTGTWKIDTASEEMEAVTVSASRAPFRVKNDTLEFNASSFKSLPTDMVQDLLRKLPGMQVDAEGNVTVNGKKVNKIRVDGREFFSGNMKVALENLPGSVIDKVQVMDTRERGTENNSIIKPLNENVTLNLTLKEDKKRGSFGNAFAGYGSSDRYNANAFVNTMSGAKRLSLIANTGNTSGIGGMMMGRGGHGEGQGMMMSENQGLLKNASMGGISWSNDVGRKGKLDLNYNINSREQPSETMTDRVNILPDSSFLYKSNSRNNSVGRGHILMGNYELIIDTLQYLSVNTSLNVSNSQTEAWMNAQSTTTNNSLINSQQNFNDNDSKSMSLNNSFAYSLSDRSRKTSLNINWSLVLQRNSGDRINQSKNIYYYPSYREDSLNQQGTSKGNNVSNNVSLNVHRKLTKKLSAILNYTFLQNGGVSDVDIFNYNSADGKYSKLDSLYSNHNRNTNLTHLGSASLGYRLGRLSVEMGGVYRIIDQKNRLVWKDSTIQVKQRNFSPRLSTSFQLSKLMTVTTNYSAESAAPTTDQLAPVQDNTNPLYIRVGNPFLKTSITHNIGTDINVYARDYKRQAFLRGSAAFTQNQIVDDTYYDTLGRQISSYRNVNGTHIVSFMAGGGNRLKLNDWALYISLAANLNLNRNVSLVEGELNTGNTVDFAPQLSLNFMLKDKVIIQATGSMQYHTTKYSLGSIADINYRLARMSVFTRFSPVKRLVINGSFFYTFNGQLPADFQRIRSLINTGISYNLLKSQKLTVGISINDLLNQNVNLNRSVTPTAIQTTQTISMRRYGMLTLQYRFNYFGKIK